MAKRIAITGLGPITAVGIGKEDLWNSVKAGRGNVVLHKQYVHDEYWDGFYLAKVQDFDLNRFGFDTRAIERLCGGEEDNADLYYLLAGAKLAIEDSRLSYDRDDNNIGLILAHENPGVDRYMRKIWEAALTILDDKQWPSSSLSGKDFIRALYHNHARTVYDMQTFMYLYYASKILGLHGFSLFINNACASGLFALEAASHQIKSGSSPVVVIAGGDNPVLITKYLWFSELGLYAEDGIMRPFDRQRAGFIFGDGSGALVVEDYEHAVRRGAYIYAEYLGGGFNQEGWKISVPAVDRHYYWKAFRDALINSGIEPGEIDLVNPHGVATGISDLYEAKVATDVFGEYPRKPLITAFKPYVGHILGGSAFVELIILLLALNHNFVPMTLNYTDPDPSVKLRLVREPLEKELQIVAKMSSGFGGYNAVGIFKKVA